MNVNFDKITERFTALWNREVLDRCCISVIYQDQEKTGEICAFPEKQEDREKYWTDGEMVLNRNLACMEHTYYAGDAFPLVWLNLGPSGHAAFTKGVRWGYEPSTIWFEPIMEEELEPEKITLCRESFFYTKTIELAKYFTEESRGRYLVSMPDLAGNLDALAHLRGSQDLMMDFVSEEPEVIMECERRIQKLWEAGVSEAYEITKAANHGGSCIGWLNTWAPGFHSQMQCDLSVMISKELFDQFEKPELERQSSFLEYPLYHFDGIEQIRHLDTLLSIDKIQMIQWTSVVGQPSPIQFIDEMKRIQDSGKCLLLTLKPNEVEAVVGQLSSKGLFINVTADSRETADAVVKIAEKYSRE
ncbi:hypothetical protein [uncultured Robinsoniella sp.]|uniref:hypothetical protein n=1 Tax=uncultured Robinsoniella sp. TaxID=904190 RepID=UPI00374ED8EF